MFGKGSIKSSGNIGTLISHSSVFDGNLQCDGAIRIDGKINGNIKAAGDVYIGKTAAVKGNIIGNNVYLSGIVTGQVHAAGMLKLYADARLTGDIEVQSFVADEGALYQGNCIMLETKHPEKYVVSKKQKPDDKQGDKIDK